MSRNESNAGRAPGIEFAEDADSGDTRLGSESRGGERGNAMAERIERTSRRAGFEEAAAMRARELFERVIAHRRPAVDDDRDPELLHPGRTAIILIEDLRTLDYACVAAGIALDSLHPERTPDAGTLAAWGEVEAARLLEEIPLGADDEILTEALVTASAAARAVALAERLDHARHLHLRDAQEWGAFHHGVERLYLPLAARTDATLERRYRWWTRMFARRFLPA